MVVGHLTYTFQLPFKMLILNYCEQPEELIGRNSTDAIGRFGMFRISVTDMCVFLKSNVVLARGGRTRYFILCLFVMTNRSVVLTLYFRIFTYLDVFC